MLTLLIFIFIIILFSIHVLILLHQNFFIFCFFCNFIIQGHMKRPSKVNPLPTTIAHLKSTLPSNLQKQERDPLQIGSIASLNKRQKVPESMKTFLKQRKNIKTPRNSTRPINKILQLSGNHLNSSNTPFSENQFANELDFGQIFYQNPPQDSLKKPKQSQKPKSKQQYLNPIICPICEGQIEEKYMIKAFSCRHLFCQDCIKSYVKFKINMFEQVPCPQDSCRSFMNTDSDFYKGLPQRERKIYKKINNFYTTQSDSSKKLCPKQNCEGVITLQEGAESQTCPECKRKFCSNCYLEKHWGQCQDFQIKFMQDTLNYRQCRKCRIVIEKKEGCDHITCKCGYQFCYICGGQWKHGHICDPLDLEEEESGCDWGQNWLEHSIFLIKLPLKLVLIIIYSLFWLGVSCSSVPYNLFLFFYWLMILLFVGVGEFIFAEEERSCGQILLLLIIFPVLIVYCLPRGIRLLMNQFQEQFPMISAGYRIIIRI